MTTHARGFALAAVVLAAVVLAACSSSGSKSTPSSTTAGKPAATIPSVASAEAQASNPVDLIHKLPGCKTEDTVGEPDLFGARDAKGWWEPQDPISDPRTGAVTYGQLIEVTTFPTHELAVEDLARRNPDDGTAVLAGDLWDARLTAGEQAGKTAFIPSPQNVASQLGGTVVHVWP